MLNIDFQISEPQWKKIATAHKKLFHTALNATADALELPKKQFSVAVSFISDEEMTEINGQFRGKHKPTNVLSFPLYDDFSALDHVPDPVELGDIVLAYETVMREAGQEDKTIANHTAHLLVHGLLHLFGYDHMTKKDEREMEALEIEILQSLDIANPY
jgi:probable rRNA maturation factor